MDIKNRISVLFLIPTLAHGGAEKVLVNLVNNMDKTKFDVSLQTLFDIGVNRDIVGEDVHYLPGYKKAIPGNSHIMKLFSPERLYKHFIKDKYDIVVSYLEGPTARIVSGCTNPNTKLVSWIHTTHQLSMKNASSRFRSNKEAQSCYERFDKTICVSNTVKKDFQSIFNLKKPVEVLYNTNESALINEIANKEIDDMTFDKNVFNLISVGKLSHTKGYDRLLRIHKRLIDEGIKNHIYILGIGEEESTLKKYIAKNNLSESFTLLGFKGNPYKYVKNADLYVCSSRREGFSTAVTEALIVGTPVVSTNCSGAYELLGYNNEYGIVTENSEESLYNGIKKMLTSENLLNEYRAKALERGSFFSTEKTVSAVEKMLNEL